MRNRVAWLAAILAGLLLVGAGVLGILYRLSMDAWYHEGPTRAHPQPWTKIPDSQVVPVSRQELPQAEQMLLTVPVVKLSMAQAEELTGKRLIISTGRTPHLVRALFYNAATGGFEVRSRGTELSVVHSSLSFRSMSMKRSALIVLLTSTPTQVYVTCNVAE